MRGDASSTAFMNFTTSSYVDVDLKPVASGVVLRSATGDFCWADVTRPVTARAKTATDARRIKMESSVRNPTSLHGYHDRERTAAAGDVDREPGAFEVRDLAPQRRVEIL